MSGRSALLVYNPVAGGGTAERYLRSVRRILQTAGFDLEDAPTREPGHATEIARAAREIASHQALFAVGGDGTQREVAAGLLGGDLPLAILSAGTTNVLALALDLPRNPIEAATAFGGSTERRQMSVGLCNGQPFLMMASCGIDAEALAATTSQNKQRWGQAAVLKSALTCLMRYGFPAMRVNTAGTTTTPSFIVAANIPWYGGPFEMAPAADPFRNNLELVEWHGKDRGAFLTFLLDVGVASHLRRDDASARTVDSLTIESDGRFCYQLDGDAFWTEEPLHIEMSSQRLPLLLPHFAA